MITRLSLLLSAQIATGVFHADEVGDTYNATLLARMKQIQPSQS
jgi:hypothetical protein